jgi:cobalamin biosynthesis Mg chelatase CobN
MAFPKAGHHGQDTITSTEPKGRGTKEPALAGGGGQTVSGAPIRSPVHASVGGATVTSSKPQGSPGVRSHVGGTGAASSHASTGSSTSTDPSSSSSNTDSGNVSGSYNTAEDQPLGPQYTSVPALINTPPSSSGGSSSLLLFALLIGGGVLIYYFVRHHKGAAPG